MIVAASFFASLANSVMKSFWIFKIVVFSMFASMVSLNVLGSRIELVCITSYSGSILLSIKSMSSCELIWKRLFEIGVLLLIDLIDDICYIFFFADSIGGLSFERLRFSYGG